LVRDGWQPKTDDEPAEYAFTEPIMADWMNTNLVVPGPGDGQVSVKGRVLERGDFDRIQSEFYELRGWDKETGLQKAETLNRLNMTDVAEDLKERGLVS